MIDIKIGDTVYLPIVDYNFNGTNRPAILIQAYKVIDISQKGELKVKSSGEYGWQEDDEMYFPTVPDAICEGKKKLFQNTKILFYDINGKEEEISHE